MVFKRIVRGIIGIFHKADDWSTESQEKVYKVEKTGKETGFEEIHGVWDYLKFKANTQAYHLSNVLGFDEWVDMTEIRRRIKELFKVEYKNERSLYPYLKTLTDVGLMESNSIGGRMQWRKHDLMVKINKKEEERQVVAVKTGQVKKPKKEEE